jgi:hypothetical protein
MLRIQRSANGDIVVFTLSGRIRVEYLAEMQRVFGFEGQQHCVVLDLKEVKLVDRDVVKFLAHCEAQGTTLKNCPLYIREWIRRGTESLR